MNTRRQAIAKMSIAVGALVATTMCRGVTEVKNPFGFEENPNGNIDFTWYEKDGEVIAYFGGKVGRVPCVSGREKHYKSLGCSSFNMRIFSPKAQKWKHYYVGVGNSSDRGRIKVPSIIDCARNAFI